MILAQIMLPDIDFVGRHPTIRMLALAFLFMIGAMLMVDGTGHHVPTGSIYFAMAFSLFVELLNMKAGSRGAKPVKLR
jgi:predicted tellurium resistance membrane protein TerC